MYITFIIIVMGKHKFNVLPEIQLTRGKKKKELQGQPSANLKHHALN